MVCHPNNEVPQQEKGIKLLIHTTWMDLHFAEGKKLGQEESIV